MPAKSVRINDTVFPSKTAATKTIRALLYKYDIGQRLNEVDAHFMCGVLALHPHAAQKIGCGISVVSVEAGEFNRCFWLTRVDGTRTDFSYVACLTPPTHADEVKSAFRHEVSEQIIAFRRAHLTHSSVCPVTGEPLTSDNVHVDHVSPTFNELLFSFLGTTSADDIGVSETTDGSTVTSLIDKTVAARWRDYHQRHAVLRLLSRRANLRRRA